MSELFISVLLALFAYIPAPRGKTKCSFWSPPSKNKQTNKKKNNQKNSVHKMRANTYEHANARFSVQEKKKDNFASNIDILKTKLMPYPLHP